MAGTILDPVRVATTSNINVSQIWLATETLPTIDGVGPLVAGANQTGDRILVKAQSVKSQNGIYVVQSFTDSGIAKVRLARATGFADTDTIAPNTIVFVSQGDIQADTGWLVSNNSAATVGTDNIEFSRFTVNLALGGLDLPSSLILRKENGRPLTNDQLDGNFKYLYDSLVSKLDISGFTPTTVRDKINTLTAQQGNLNAWKLQDRLASVSVVNNTIPIRDNNGALASTLFIGDLDGKATEAFSADSATLAGNVTGVVQLVHGGTGGSTATEARNNLNAVGRTGDTLTGKLNLNAGISSGVAPLNFAVAAPLNPIDGDFWAGTVLTNGQISDYRLYYKFNNVTRSIAHLESPNLQGTPTTPNVNKSISNTQIANTFFVKENIDDVMTEVNLKAPLASPGLTGTPTAPTPETTVENTRIATTAYVKNKLTSVLTSYDTVSSVDSKISTARNELTQDIETAQETADEALQRSGLPAGSVAYFAGENIPLGWLEANGAFVSKTVYPALFAAIGYSYNNGINTGDNFKLPDLRGEFIRGWDNGRGMDPGRALGSWQIGSLHIHNDERDSFTGGAWNNMWNDGNGYSHANDGIKPYGNGHANELGYDAMTFEWLSAYADTMTKGDMHSNYPAFAGIYEWRDGTINLNPGTTYRSNHWIYMGRPRNVAMRACIKAFGSLINNEDIDVSNLVNGINQRVAKAGDSMTGFLTLHANPSQNLHAATKQYVDTTVSNIDVSATAVMKAGSTMTGPLTLSGAPTANLHAATKKYVDDKYDDLFANAGTPVGTITYYPSSTIPSGWMECDGRELSTTTYARLFQVLQYKFGGAGAVFKLPDLRGEFIRGWDNGRGIDPNRVFGSFQRGSAVLVDDGNNVLGPSRDANGTSYSMSQSRGSNYQSPDLFYDKYDGLGNIAHALASHEVGYNNYYSAVTEPGYFMHARPRNVALVACIKVFGTVDDPSQITAQGVLNDVAGKVNKSGDTMTGNLIVPAPTQANHAATKQYVDTLISSASTGLLVTSGQQYVTQSKIVDYGGYGEDGSYYPYLQTIEFNNNVGSWDADLDFFYVYPPAGKTMANLMAFIASVHVIHFNGRVDGNDSFRCTWAAESTRIKVYVGNTEQRARPAANWLAVWS
jgi:microcystin-dependent protein